MQRLLREETGAVQLYVMLLLIPIFIFHAVLIDFIRVKAAELDAEIDVKAGARSVLAAFNPDLRLFGLFGLGTDSGASQTTFAEVVNGQSVPPDEDHFSFLDITADPDSFQLQTLYSLANPDIFTRQVEMDMRYRAPVEYAMEAADKWKQSGVTQKLDGEAAYAEAAKELDDLRQKREAAMDEAWQAAQSFTESGKHAYIWANEELSKLHDLADEIGFTDLDAIHRAISSVSDQLSESQNELQALQEALTEKQSLLEKARKASQPVQALRANVQGIQNDLESVDASISDLEQQQADLSTRLSKAMEYAAKAAEIKGEVEREQRLLEQALAPVTLKLEEAKQNNTEMRAAIDRQRSGLVVYDSGAEAALRERLVYPAQLWDKYETDTGSIVALWSGFRLQWGDAFWVVGDTYTSLSDGLQAFGSKLDQFLNDRTEKERQRTAADLAEANSRTDQQNRTKLTLQTLKSELTGCSGNGDGSSFQSRYDQLKALFEKYKAYGGDSNAVQTKPALLGDDESIGATAFSFARKLGEQMSSVRSELFFDEYALTHFGYRTKPANAAGDGSGSITGQEVEYALYGFSSCTSNEAAAYSEMYLLLLAIRTSEGLLSPEAGAASVGTPILSLLTSIASGAAEAAEDMNKIISGDPVALVRKLPGVTVTYKDLLRLFLIVHSNDAGITARLQSLIELDTGNDLSKAYTYVQATAESTVRLWFPGMLDEGLYRIGLTRCEPMKARCLMTSTAVAAYD